MAATTATAAFGATARTSDRRDGAGSSPSPQLWWGGSGRTKAYGHRRQPARGPAEYFEHTSDDGRPAGGELAGAVAAGEGHAAHGLRAGARPLVPQLGHELVDVPNVVSVPEFQQHSVEHNVDIKVRGGVGRRGVFMEAFAETWLCWDKSGFARLWRSCAGLSTRRGALLRVRSSSPWPA